MDNLRVEHATCLVVDDDPWLRRLVRRTLERGDWRVIEARNGREALAQLQSQIPDLILLDLMMPVMDGFEFLVELRQNTVWHSVPVIVMTALELSPEERAQLTGHVVNVLQKGAYNLRDLVREVSRTVARQI